jgi:hypothetical protein
MKNSTIANLFGSILFAVLLSIGSFNVQAAQDSEDAVLAEAERGGYQLIDIDALEKLYKSGDQKKLLIDTRQEWEYHSGYIKGAVNFPLEPTWLARMTRRSALAQLLGSDKSQTLVFY